MRVLKLIAAAALILCAAWLIFCDVEWVNDTPAVPGGAVRNSETVMERREAEYA